MASGHRKRKADALRIEVLNPIGLTNLPESERGNTTNLNNLMNIAFYSRDGAAPTFTAGSTTTLSDKISNADGAFTKAGLNGETTNAGAFVVSSMSGAIGLLSNNVTTKHYYFPAIGSQTDLSSSGVTGPVIIYSPEGPQAGYVPYYFGGTTTTSSIKFGVQITGSGTPSHVVIYIGGHLSANDVIEIRKASDNTIFGGRVMTGSDTVIGSSLVVNGATASASDLSNALYRKAIFVPTSSFAAAQGMIIDLSSSAKTSTTPVAGVFVVVSSGSYNGGVP